MLDSVSCLGFTPWVIYVLVHSRYYYLAENAENVVAGRAIQMRTGRGRLLDAGFRAQSLTTTPAESSR